MGGWVGWTGDWRLGGWVDRVEVDEGGGVGWKGRGGVKLVPG